MTLNLSLDALEKYLQQSLDGNVSLEGVGKIGDLSEQGMKDFGYGKPLLVRYIQDGTAREAVLSIMKGDEYGHQFFWDRAAILMFQYATESHMHKHVRPVGLGYVNQSGTLVGVQDPKEFFILHEKIEGHDYFLDLERIRKGDFREQDLTLARDFARWMATIHAQKREGEDLYLRRIRELVGSSECIFGLIDGYPFPYQDFPQERFLRLEKRLIDWRWKLRGYTHRLAAVHGDFHPWNVLVREDGDFTVLDRSRGEWGEPADDLATMTCNYLLYGLYNNTRLEGPFAEMYTAMWEEYLAQTGDHEVAEVIAPFYVFRGLVIASPQWYPTHPDSVRQGLFRFLENVLEDEQFDYKRINDYMRGSR